MDINSKFYKINSPKLVSSLICGNLRTVLIKAYACLHVCGALIGTAESATIQVNSPADSSNPSQCTLRDAVESFNNQSLVSACAILGNNPFRSGDTIIFAANLARSTITLSGERLAISTGNILTIDAGPVGGVTIDGNNDSGVWDVVGSAVIFNGLAIIGGRVINGNGGGIRASGSTLNINNSVIADNFVTGTIFSSSGSGGGVSAINSSVNLFNTTVARNSATGPLLLGGGGIFLSRSNATIRNSTLSNNEAPTQRGGGIRAQTSSEVAIINSTFSDNIAPGFSGAQGQGVFASNSTISIEQSTFSNSAIDVLGGEIDALQNSTLTIGNTIIANSAGKACNLSDSQLLLQGANFTNDGNCGTQSSSINLGSLADNGCVVTHASPNGQSCVMTHALLDGSVAIDAAIGSAVLDDQRGMRRVSGVSDVGAFEVDSDLSVDSIEDFLVLPLRNENTAIVPL